MTYFSDRELGERPRDGDEIGERTWGGLQALIKSKIDNGWFGAAYPAKTCPDDDQVVTGSDADTLASAIHAEIPNLPEWPWNAGRDEQPNTADILDMVEFSWRCIGKRIERRYHTFYGHHHLTFDVEAGREQFREEVNRIFSRNGIAYTITNRGRIERLVPTVLREELGAAHFRTHDSELNSMLEKACRKFLDYHEEKRREALEALWDAWERLKTLGEGQGKKAQVSAILDAAADSSSSKYRKALECEAKELTRLGNTLQIRHSEKDQEKIQKSEHVDYLFHRLFSLIQLIVRTAKI